MLSFLLFLPGLLLLVMASGFVFFLLFGFSEQEQVEAPDEAPQVLEA